MHIPGCVHRPGFVSLPGSVCQVRGTPTCPSGLEPTCSGKSNVGQGALGHGLLLVLAPQPPSGRPTASDQLACKGSTAHDSMTVPLTQAEVICPKSASAQASHRLQVSWLTAAAQHVTHAELICPDYSTPPTATGCCCQQLSHATRLFELPLWPWQLPHIC